MKESERLMSKEDCPSFSYNKQRNSLVEILKYSIKFDRRRQNDVWSLFSARNAVFPSSIKLPLVIHRDFTPVEAKNAVVFLVSIEKCER